MSAPSRLGVLGWPVAHSRSPAMHNAALRAIGLAGWRYQHLPVPPGLFAETVRALPAAGFRGANVTIPHKEAALELITAPSAELSAVGAINTLLFDPDGEVRGANTDAPALLDALPSPVRGRTALVLGAGGTARAAVSALRGSGAARVAVWNRTPRRARELADSLDVEAVVRPEAADVLVNCTSVGLHGEDPFKMLPLAADDLHGYGCVVDYVYATGETQLLREARRREIPTVDGLTLLAGQGELAFALFTGARPPAGLMQAAVSRR